MGKWIIRYWVNESGKSPIEKWVQKLTEEQAILVTKELRMLEELGNELQLPHSRSLGKGLLNYANDDSAIASIIALREIN